MPVEQSDNTRVAQPKFILKAEEVIPKLPIVLSRLDLLWDTDKVKMYLNMLNFYNNNFWGYGVFGNLTNFDPRTSLGLAAIQSNFDYAKSNALNFGEALVTTGAGEGAVLAFKWATTPTRIGSGAEAIVSSAPASSKVTKVTTIPKSEMHVRNTVPGALKAKYIDSSNGLHTYTQRKVKILSPNQLARATSQLEKLMLKAGWRKVTHPNLQGVGFTNGRYVVTDLGSGNIGKDWFGRPRLTDFSIETVPEFKLAMQRKGGILK